MFDSSSSCHNTYPSQNRVPIFIPCRISLPLSGSSSIFVVHTGPKANTKITQTSRFTWFPKPGTSTEAADCILMEEWYKHSTQPNTTPQNPVFHSYTRFSQICTFSRLSQLHCLPLSAHTCTVFMPSLHCTLSRLSLYRRMEKHWQQPMCRTNYYNDKSHGGWRKVDKNVDNCYTFLLNKTLKILPLFSIDVEIAPQHNNGHIILIILQWYTLRSCLT